MNKKTFIEVSIVVLIIILGVAGYFYWKGASKTPQEKALDSIGETSDILDRTATQGVLPSINTDDANPLKDNPDVNPVNKANPFINIKTNPFE